MRLSQFPKKRVGSRFKSCPRHQTTNDFILEGSFNFSSSSSYGIVCGIGCAMVRETSSLMLGQYFKRRRELVEALSSSGIGFGIAIFSNVYHQGLG